MNRSTLVRPHTVTFDCWSTLIQEAPRTPGSVTRGQIVAQLTGADEQQATAALKAAFRRHQMQWHRQQMFTGADMTREVLGLLGISLEPERLHALIDTLESYALTREIRVVDGAAESLERLAQASVRRALICDTGFTPGRIVRQLLDRAGLLGWFDVLVFSDEVGVPKPHLRPFQTALERLGAAAEGAVHVGDLRRTDIAGARACGMGTVRFAGVHDDADTVPAGSASLIDCAALGCDPICERPEADAIVRSFAALTAQLGF